jgi:hypothetical protein
MMSDMRKRPGSEKREGALLAALNVFFPCHYLRP